MRNPDLFSIKEAEYHFADKQEVYNGKVRDVYSIDDKLIMVASDRISAFDHILPRAIPFKGQVLNQIAQHFLNGTKDLVPNWLSYTPDANVSIGVKCEPIRIEMVIRGYLAGHAWRTYKSGERILCGVQMPDGMKEGDKFPEPIITPATKAEEGHDEDISKEEILKQGLVSEDIYILLESYTKSLFKRGSEMAESRGLILVDTKYEFGMYNGQPILIDEIHTPDSSRYYILDGYTERQENGERQMQLSKEFVREWLMANGFQGKEGQSMPEMPDEFVWEISDRYIDLYERLTDNKFERIFDESIKERIENNVRHALTSFGEISPKI